MTNKGPNDTPFLTHYKKPSIKQSVVDVDKHSIELSSGNIPLLKFWDPKQMNEEAKR